MTSNPDPAAHAVSDFANLIPGDYVLATKWSDGDPNDAWAVGYVIGERAGRILVGDAEGVTFRPGGFRKARVIRRDVGAWLVSISAELEECPPGTVSLWTMLTGAAFEGGETERLAPGATPTAAAVVSRETPVGDRQAGLTLTDERQDPTDAAPPTQVTESQIADAFAYAVWMVGNMDTIHDKRAWWHDFEELWKFAGERVTGMAERGVTVGAGFDATGLGVALAARGAGHDR